MPRDCIVCNAVITFVSSPNVKILKKELTNEKEHQENGKNK